MATEKIIRVKDEYYILAASALADDRRRVLKHGDTFAVLNRYGDIQPVGLGEQGIYHDGTRFLSRLEIMLGTTHPFFLSSGIKEDNALLTVDLTNPDLYLDDLIQRGTLHLSRSILLWQACCYEQTTITNYGLTSLTVPFSFHYDADFRDIFEVRGLKRLRRGNVEQDLVEPGTILVTYRGLDGVVRRTRIRCSPQPTASTASSLMFEISLEPKEEKTISLSIGCEMRESVPAPLPFEIARANAFRALERSKRRYCHLYTSNEQFNDWLNRSLDDLCMMTTDKKEGPYPYAGVPWFNTAFGRDAIITALMCLWVNPGLARGVLSFLAATQAKALIPHRDAEPGKVIHETRGGEMAALKEIPFEMYYGSVDATPLFVLLAGAYYERTGDKEFLESLWPHIERALIWMNDYGDADGDGFVEYQRRSPSGLIHQGWKDSHDSIFHADGTLAEGPIALCEVQGYVYAAKIAAAKMADALDWADAADELLREAATLRHNFERAFWDDELSTYVLALDGDKTPCRVKASNAGHCLFAEIADSSRAEIVADGLLSNQFFSGWGIRTVATTEARYNPMSYHNGSIWPHDNALISLGMSRYGLRHPVQRVLAALFDMSISVELHRLPELICGFDRRPGEAPTLYPVACAPQSWASAAVFMLLQSCLGLTIDALQSEIRLSYPSLPEFLQRLQIENLRVGSASVDLVLERRDHDLTTNITRKEGDVNVVIVK